MTRQSKKKTFLPRFCFESHANIFKCFMIVCLLSVICLLLTSIYQDSQLLISNHREDIIKEITGETINDSPLHQHHPNQQNGNKNIVIKEHTKENPAPEKQAQPIKERLVERLNKQAIKDIPDQDLDQNSLTRNRNVISPEKTFTPLSFESTLEKFYPNEGFQSQELKYIIDKCAPKNYTTLHLPINYDKSAFVIEESTLCSGNIFLLIAVHSYTSNKHRRDLIRRTWGSFRQIDGNRVQIVFFVGRKEAESEIERMQLLEEIDTYRDIVVRDFIEHYRNITYKHVTIMKWLALYCTKAEYLLKVDDDTFVDVFHIVHFVKMHSLTGFICKSVITKPVRDKKSTSMSKWFVTKEEFSGDMYPQYCEGFGYIMLAKHARHLYWCSVYSKFFWIDDVYITGILRSKLGIEIEKFWVGHSWDNMLPSYASEKIADIMLLVASHNEIIPEIWDSIWKAILRFNIL